MNKKTIGTIDQLTNRILRAVNFSLWNEGNCKQI